MEQPSVREPFSLRDFFFSPLSRIKYFAYTFCLSAITTIILKLAVLSEVVSHRNYFIWASCLSFLFLSPIFYRIKDIYLSGRISRKFRKWWFIAACLLDIIALLSSMTLVDVDYDRYNHKIFSFDHESLFFLSLAVFVSMIQGIILLFTRGRAYDISIGYHPKSE